MISLIFIYGLFLLLSVSLALIVKPTQKENSDRDSQAVSFIIPFKNEADRIHTLIQSLNQALYPNDFEIIFVDDHSSDHTVDLLMANLDIPFKLLRLKETFGKKAAITHGVHNSTYQQIHTLDADITFEANFLRHVCQVPSADFTILPVHLLASTVFQKLNSVEFQWLQTFTFAFAKIKRPTLCNGANLSFNRSIFLDTLPTRTDWLKPSGDDTYLLAAVRKAKGKIKARNHPNFAVQTETPSTFRSLLSQRKRWIRKSINLPSILMLLLYIAYHALPWYAIVFVPNELAWGVPMVLKILSELTLSRRYTIEQLVLVILHQVYYPIYGLFLLLSFSFKPQWK